MMSDQEIEKLIKDIEEGKGINFSISGSDIMTSP